MTTIVDLWPNTGLPKHGDPVLPHFWDFLEPLFLQSQSNGGPKRVFFVHSSSANSELMWCRNMKKKIGFGQVKLKRQREGTGALVFLWGNVSAPGARRASFLTRALPVDCCR